MNQLKDQKADLTHRLTNTQDDMAATQTFSQDMQSQLVKRDEVSFTIYKILFCCQHEESNVSHQSRRCY